MSRRARQPRLSLLRREIEGAGLADSTQRYFFDLVGPGEREVDDVGLRFSDLDAAYMDAHRAIDEISREMLRNRTDFRLYRFEIRDERGRLLMETPFDERLRGAVVRPPHEPNDLAARVQATLERNRRLRSEVAGGLDETRAVVAELHATVQRVRDASSARVDPACG